MKASENKIDRIMPMNFDEQICDAYPVAAARDAAALNNPVTTFERDAIHISFIIPGTDLAAIGKIV